MPRITQDRACAKCDKTFRSQRATLCPDCLREKQRNANRPARAVLTPGRPAPDDFREYAGAANGFSYLPMSWREKKGIVRE
jgi:predicted amidophosphoribosyltransferase